MDRPNHFYDDHKNIHSLLVYYICFDWRLHIAETPQHGRDRIYIHDTQCFPNVISTSHFYYIVLLFSLTVNYM